MTKTCLWVLANVSWEKGWARERIILLRIAAPNNVNVDGQEGFNFPFREKDFFSSLTGHRKNTK